MEDENVQEDKDEKEEEKEGYEISLELESDRSDSSDSEEDISYDSLSGEDVPSECSFIDDELLIDDESEYESEEEIDYEEYKIILINDMLPQKRKHAEIEVETEKDITALKAKEKSNKEKKEKSKSKEKEAEESKSSDKNKPTNNSKKEVIINSDNELSVENKNLDLGFEGFNYREVEIPESTKECFDIIESKFKNEINANKSKSRSRVPPQMEDCLVNFYIELQNVTPLQHKAIQARLCYLLLIKKNTLTEILNRVQSKQLLQTLDKRVITKLLFFNENSSRHLTDVIIPLSPDVIIEKIVLDWLRKCFYDDNSINDKWKEIAMVIDSYVVVSNIASNKSIPKIEINEYLVYRAKKFISEHVDRFKSAFQQTLESNPIFATQKVLSDASLESFSSELVNNMRLYLATRSRDELKSFRVSLLKKVDLTASKLEDNDKNDKMPTSTPNTPKKVPVENKVEQPKAKKQKTAKPLILEKVEPISTHTNEVVTEIIEKKSKKTKVTEAKNDVENKIEKLTDKSKFSGTIESPIIIVSESLNDEFEPLNTTIIESNKANLNNDSIENHMKSENKESDYEESQNENKESDYEEPQDELFENRAEHENENENENEDENENEPENKNEEPANNFETDDDIMIVM